MKNTFDQTTTNINTKHHLLASLNQGQISYIIRRMYSKELDI